MTSEGRILHVSSSPKLAEYGAAMLSPHLQALGRLKPGERLPFYSVDELDGRMGGVSGVTVTVNDAPELEEILRTLKEQRFKGPIVAMINDPREIIRPKLFVLGLKYRQLKEVLVHPRLQMAFANSKGEAPIALLAKAINERLKSRLR